LSNSVFVDMVKALKDEDVNFAFERRHSGEFSGYIDTGSYLLNGQISGSMYGGMPNNKVWAIAGETTTGKTFFALGVVKFFLDSHPDAACFYYDTEAALTADMLEERGIDSRRIIIGEPATIQEFRHKVITVLNRYKDIPKKDRPPMFMVLDSMGNLSSTKEVEDTESGVETRDMTKSQLLRATWRVIRLKLAKVDVAMIVTNHTYMGIGLYASKEMCLAEGSEIKTPSGLMEIQKLKIGDTVDSLFGESRVSAVHEVDVQETYTITFEDGTNIETTAEHKFLVNGEWTTVADLVKNLDLINIDVADMLGEINVYREQVHKMLL
jgi:RecA/RadA recombinase